MKKCFFFVAFLIATNVMAQGIFWDNEEGSQDYMIPVDTVSLHSLELKGKVKSVTSQLFMAVVRNGKVEEGDKCPDDFAYVDSEAPESPVTEYTYAYDNKGRMTRSLVMNYLTTYQYDGQGRMVRRVNQNQDENISAEYRPEKTVVFHYGADGNISSADFSENNKLTHRERYRYDSRNNLVAVTTLDKNNTTVSTLTARFEYDSKGRLTLKEFKEPGYQPRSVHYTYDKNGKIATVTSTDRNGDTNTWQGDEETDSKPIYLFGIPTYRDGMIVEWKPEADSDEVYMYSFVYDDYGNWIKYIEYKNQQPTIVQKRTITYY